MSVPALTGSLQIDAPPPAPPSVSPPPPGAGPDAAETELQRLTHELESERERRAAVEAAFDRQRVVSRRLQEECARLRTELEQGDHHVPPPAWDDRPVNPALRTKWRWILRVLALLVMLVVLGAVYLLVHAYITHETIQHVWSQVRNFF